MPKVQQEFFVLGPGGPDDIGFQVVVPSFPTLLADSLGKGLGNLSPSGRT